MFAILKIPPIITSSIWLLAKAKLASQKAKPTRPLGKRIGFWLLIQSQIGSTRQVAGDCQNRITSQLDCRRWIATAAAKPPLEDQNSGGFAAAGPNSYIIPYAKNTRSRCGLSKSWKTSFT
jgi:hypothetical protein